MKSTGEMMLIFVRSKFTICYLKKVQSTFFRHCNLLFYVYFYKSLLVLDLDMLT